MAWAFACFFSIAAVSRDCLGIGTTMWTTPILLARGFVERQRGKAMLGGERQIVEDESHRASPCGCERAAELNWLRLRIQLRGAARFNGGDIESYFATELARRLR